MATEHAEHTEGSAAPPIVAVEVIRRGGALVAFETYGMTLASVTFIFAANWLLGFGRGGNVLLTLVAVNLFVLLAATTRLAYRRDVRVELSALGINVVAGAWRSRALTWPEVTDLVEQRILGSDELSAQVSGRLSLGTHLLSSGWGPWRDPDYAAKAQRIRDYWTAYRWSTFPPPGDPPPPPLPPAGDTGSAR
jgi:hypothetical protein